MSKRQTWGRRGQGELVAKQYANTHSTHNPLVLTQTVRGERREGWVEEGIGLEGEEGATENEDENGLQMEEKERMYKMSMGREEGRKQKSERRAEEQ